MSAEPFEWRAGGCHCGGVRFEVALPPVIEAQDCNCSMWEARAERLAHPSLELS